MSKGQTRCFLQNQSKGVLDVPRCEGNGKHVFTLDLTWGSYLGVEADLKSFEGK